MLMATPDIIAAREKWTWRGQARPPFAEPTAEGERSVWDFPRPPMLETVVEPVRVLSDRDEIARSERTLRVLETAGAPTYYLPPDDVDESMLRELGATSVCEWKGVATSFALAGRSTGLTVAWSYRQAFPEFLDIAGWYAFYPTQLSCYVGDELVTAQPGGYYGGWVTRNLKGPIKGEPGSGHW